MPLTDQGSLREKKKAECRRQILRAARNLFDQKGYYDTSISEIANKANISSATLFNYFPTKLNLMEALEQMKLQDFTTVLQKHSHEAAANLQKLLLVFDNYIDDIYRYPRLSFQIAEFHAFGILTDDSNAAVTQQVENLIHQAIDTGECREGVTVEVVKSIFFSLALTCVSKTNSPHQCLDAFARILRLVAQNPDTVVTFW